MGRGRTDTALYGMAMAGVFPLMLDTGAVGQGTPTGTILGYILDPYGLAVPGAQVIVDRPTMATTRSVTSNEQGACSVPALMSSLYYLTMEAKGLNAKRLDGAVIGISRLARLDVTLTIGSKSDSITVLGSAEYE